MIIMGVEEGRNSGCLGNTNALFSPAILSNWFSVIDFRNWRQIYGAVAQKTIYTPKKYIEYLEIIQGLAKKYEVTPQEVDIAIWQTDVERKQKLPMV